MKSFDLVLYYVQRSKVSAALVIRILILLAVGANKASDNPIGSQDPDIATADLTEEAVKSDIIFHTQFTSKSQFKVKSDFLEFTFIKMPGEKSTSKQIKHLYVRFLD